MNIEEHKARHVELHKSLDELVADYIDCQLAGQPTLGLNNTTLMMLIKWSHQQTINPEEPKR